MPVKKEKKDSGRTKSIDSPPTNVSSWKSTHQSQTSKKNQGQGDFRGQSGQKGCSHDSPTTSVNVNVIKKNIKDIS